MAPFLHELSPRRHRRLRRRQERHEAEQITAREQQRQRRERRRKKWRALKQKDNNDEPEQDYGPLTIGEYEGHHISAGNRASRPEKPPPTYQAATSRVPPKVYRDPNPNSMLNV
ncbi:unnamed protein product [Clonostachys rosea]|uniref:Uncharacterized protein n=1 Tax=Bionectria ochroleuca TaxID=29856 RepID=A0ABY6UD47_BIOOC|nr:unnamed protein product [Clonostachys rosea]